MVSRRSLNLILTCLISVCDVVGCLWHHILGNHRLTNTKWIWNACLTSYDKKPLGHSKCINFSCLNYNELSLSTHIQGHRTLFKDTVPISDLLIVFPIGTIVFSGAVEAIGTIVIPVPAEAANNWFASAYGDPKMMVIWPSTYIVVRPNERWKY